ncbi:MAG: CoA transferase, partial [Gammaproteobacteria bacterium]|nr:CoA transferase [Gammaproteobacteria bacterium]
LGLLGAEIVKIEPPGKGDICRPMLDTSNFGKGEFSPIFNGVNINKRSLAVDLKHPRGRAAVERIVAQCDVLVQNFRPGVIERLGFGYEAVKQMRPDVVYCAISGYGQAGPKSTYAAFDGAVQAASGLMASNGHASTGPTRTVSPVIDISTGMMAAFAIAAALHRRAVSGEGQFIDVAMLDSAVTLLNPVYNNYLATGQEPELLGNQSLTRIPTANVFATRDGWIQITAITQPHIRALFRLLKMEAELDDPRFADEAGQVRHSSELGERIAAALAEADTSSWIERMREIGLPVAPIASLPEVLAEAQLEHRDLTVELEAPPGLGRERLELVTTGFKTDVDGPRAARFAPAVGEHSSQLLAQFGFTAEEIDELRGSGALGTAAA